MHTRARSALAIVLAAMSALAAGGCAEALHGPRVVVYSPDRFYVRYVPIRNSAEGVYLLADGLCSETGRSAAVEESTQFVWLDVRDTTFRCISPVELPPPEEPAPVDEPTVRAS